MYLAFGTESVSVVHQGVWEGTGVTLFVEPFSDGQLLSSPPCVLYL